MLLQIMTLEDLFELTFCYDLDFKAKRNWTPHLNLICLQFSIAHTLTYVETTS